MQRTVSFVNRGLALGAVCAAVLGFSAVGCGSSNSSSTDGSSTTCDFTAASAVFTKYNCATNGCHDAAGSSAGFKMAPAGWETHLVGVNPIGGGTLEACTPADGPYLKNGTNPAMGLLINKISGTGNICTGGARMPFGGPNYLTATEIACVTSWATTLTSP